MSKVNIFISHTSKDHDFVWKLAKRMEKDLKDIADIFVDDWEIKVGDSIVRKIDEAAQKADFFIIVLSKHSIKQEWVKREIDIAFTKLTQKKSKILPIWLEISEEDIPPILAPLKAVLFKTRVIDKENYQELLRPILDHEKAKSLLKFQESVLDNITHLDIILQKKIPTRQEVQFTLNLVRESPVYERYFFSKLYSLEWFDILKSEGFFSPAKAPGPKPADKEGFYTIPYWNVLDYLERISKKVNEPDNEKYIDELLTIIKEVTEYHKQTQKLDNYHIWSSFIRILSNLPSNKISMEIVDLIPVWLDSRFGNDLQVMEIIKRLFPKFLTNNPEDIEKAERIIEYLTEIQKVEEKKLLKVDVYLLQEFFEKYLNEIAEKCTTEVIEIFTKRIKEAVSTEYEGTLNSLYDYEQAKYLLERPVELFTYILSKILLIKTQKESETVNQILKSFLEEHPLFTKIALFIIGQNIEVFKDLFWGTFKDKGEKILEGSTLFWGDELKKVLENLGSLSDEQKKLLKEKIEIATKIYTQSLEDKSKEEKEKWQAIFKQMIYKALSYDNEFKTLYEETKKITGIDAELGPAVGKIEIKTGWGESPLSIEQILEMDNTELADYLLHFKTVDFWEGPTVEALAETLRTAVKTKPEKFTENLEPFLKVGYLYVARILEGFQEALKENRSIDYEKILNFVEKYISQDEFWQDKFKVQSSMPVTHERVISSFHFFLNEALQNKECSLPERLFEKVESIIYLMLKKLLKSSKIEADREILDYPQYSINTSIGRTIEIYIKFVLKVLQSSYDKKESVKNSFIKEYKKLLDHQIIEAFTLFGMYFLNFYFHIDKDFTIEVVKSLKKGDEIWLAFIQGYLFVGRIYKNIYELMKEHYEFGLAYEFKDSIYREQLIQHISLAYLIGLESLTAPSLFYKLIEKFDSEEINQIIWFFWRQRDYLKGEDEKTQKIKDKILKFWQFIYEKLNDKGKKSLSEKEKEILSNLVRLTVFLPELKEPYDQWLKNSVKYLKYSGSIFLAGLEKFMHTGDRIKTAKMIGEILRNAPPFSYPEDKIKSFIEYLCKTPNEEVKKIGKEICDKYMESGKFFVKVICEKCN